MHHLLDPWEEEDNACEPKGNTTGSHPKDQGRRCMDGCVEKQEDGQVMFIVLFASFLPPQATALWAKEGFTRKGLVDKIADGERLAEWSKPSMRVNKVRAPVWCADPKETGT